MPRPQSPAAGLWAALEVGVKDDLTGPSRLKENAVSYVNPPSSNPGYFALASAHDPRPILVHAGVAGHDFQLALSWAHADPIRRHYYDSGANEGIGFYAEEMMLQAGYFDARPRARESIYNFMRLRALRTGDFLSDWQDPDIAYAGGRETERGREIRPSPLPRFSLEDGNVPVALQQREMLGDAALCLLVPR